MNILQKIFNDHYEEMLYSLHPRQAVIENVEKMLNCGDPSYGGAMYGCTEWGHLKFVPFRFHSRFCPTCGNKYSIDRTSSMSFKIINVQHRHCFLPSQKNFVTFFFRIVNFLTVYFLLSAVLSFVCFIKITWQNLLLLVLSLFYILLEGT